MTVSVKYSGKTGPDRRLPGIYCIHSPATGVLAAMRERPLLREFTVPFDPRLGCTLFMALLGDNAFVQIPLDHKTPDKLEIAFSRGITVKGKFPKAFAEFIRGEAAKAPSRSLRARLFGNEKKERSNSPLVLLFLPKDNPYMMAGAAKEQEGNGGEWEAHLVPGEYIMAFEFSEAQVRLPGTFVVMDAPATVDFPAKFFADGVKTTIVPYDETRCANDLFKRLR